MTSTALANTLKRSFPSDYFHPHPHCTVYYTTIHNRIDLISTMASIKQLAIRGVRSFSPDDAEQVGAYSLLLVLTCAWDRTLLPYLVSFQVINFSFPCTVIVGANGSGK